MGGRLGNLHLPSAAMGRVLVPAYLHSWSSLALEKRRGSFLQTKIFVKMVTSVLNDHFLWIANFFTGKFQYIQPYNYTDPHPRCWLLSCFYHRILKQRGIL